MRLTIAIAALLAASAPAIAGKVVDADALRAWILANERDEVVPAPEPEPPAPTTTIPGPLGITGSWTLTFNDEFSGTAVNAAKWSMNWFGQTATQITQPVNSAEIAAYDPAQCRVSGDTLQMTLAKRTVTAYKDGAGKSMEYATCFLSTMGKFEQAYGVFEARIWQPGNSTTLPYNWAAWWGNGHHNTWPDKGELDVMENLSAGPVPHYHFGSPDIAWTIKPPVPAGGWSGTWHVYSVKWAADRASFYYDGVWIGTATLADPNPKYWILGYQASTQHGGPLVFPQTMLVDYVRIYKPA